MRFISKAKYEKILENGTQKKVTELFLVDAMTCTECEARTIEELTPYIRGEFSITDIKEAKYFDAFLGDGDRYFDGKIRFTTLDEKSGSDKKTNAKILIQADNLDDALAKLKEGMKDSISDWEVYGLDENSIIDVFLYSESQNKEKTIISEEIFNKAKDIVIATKCFQPSYLKSKLQLTIRESIELNQMLFDRKIVVKREWVEDFSDDATEEVIPINRCEYIFNDN